MLLISLTIFPGNIFKPEPPKTGNVFPDWLSVLKIEEAMQHELNFETVDLRKFPIKGTPASLSAYGRPVASPKTTAALPVGTQAKFIEAAANAAHLGFSLNILLTIRWDSLFSGNDVNTLRPLPVPLRIDRLVELLRKWLKYRRLPAAYIWAREATNSEGEHWHIAFHLPQKLLPQISEFVSHQTGEAALPDPRPRHKKTEGEFACGEIGSWHLACDTRLHQQGFYLAAYLGKAEPSEVPFRGKMVPNKKKIVRGVQFGGTEEDGKYDAKQGVIIGTACRRDRFFISKFLRKTAGARRQKVRSRRVQGQHTTPKKNGSLAANRSFDRASWSRRL